MDAGKRNILVLLDNPLTNDRRVQREIQTLTENGYSVNLIATQGNGLPTNEKLFGAKIHRILDQRIFDPKQQSCYNEFAQRICEQFEFDLIHAHDHSMLHLGVKIKKLKPTIKLVYDSHELFHSWPLNISNYDSKWVWFKSWIVRKLYINREKRNGKFIDHLITVNDSLERNLRVYLDIKGKTLVLRNIPEKNNEIVKTNLLREKFNIPDSTKILVFIGANIYRKTLNLEQVLCELKDESEFAVVFICSFNNNSLAVMDWVKQNNINNVHFHDKILPNDIPKFLSSADVGLVPTWNKKDLSYWFALDNKLFEYIHSGLPVLATAQPEYKAIVEHFNCGVCVNPDESDAYKIGLRSILDDMSFYDKNALKASEELNWESEREKLVEFYHNIL